MKRLFPLSAWLVLSALLIPALICTIPGGSTNAGDADCCQHMTSEECETTNMSSCCETVPPSLALIAIGGTSAKQMNVDLDQVPQLADLLPSLHTEVGRIALSFESPPHFAPGSATQVLRI
jgi:hypothetical protein